MSLKKYIVGGWVRDKLLAELGHPMQSNDRDWVVTNATPEEMLRLKFIPIGNDFPVFLHPETHEEYALARTERKSGHGYKGFTFFADPSVTLEQDLLRRDLTINAMAMDEEGHIIDPYGGFEDLKNGVLRHVSAAFEEDPLRLLRVSRFRAKLPWFRIAEETKVMLKRMVESGEVDTLVPERVTQEIRKALAEESVSVFFDELKVSGFIDRVFPDWRQTEFSRTLLDDLRSGFTEEEKFAASIAAIDPVKLPALLDALRMPKKLNEFAMLFSESLRDGFENAAAGKEVLSVLRQKDALRRPDRFARLLRLLKAARRIDSEEKWLTSLEAVRSLDFRSISAGAPDKSRIPELIREASVRAIDDALDKLADQHQDNGDQDGAGKGNLNRVAENLEVKVTR